MTRRPRHLPSWPIGSSRIAILHRFDKEEKSEGVNYIELREEDEAESHVKQEGER